MKSSLINLRTTVFAYCISIFLLSTICGCSAAKHEKCPANKNISSSQLELIEKAFESASAIPLYPHIKERSRSQHEVVQAAIKLNQPISASEYIEQIENWRRNLAYTELAALYAETGSKTEALKYIELASQLPEDIKQEWRIDRINSEITRVNNILNSSELSVAAASNGQAADPNLGQFTGISAAYDEMLESDKPQENAAALKGYSSLFSRFYKFNDLRSDAEQKIISGFDKVPLYLRVELLIDMSKSALDNNDTEKSVNLLEQAESHIKINEWPLKYLLSVKYKVADLYFKSGNDKKTILILDSALADYDKRYEEIIDIYRAKTLIPFAELYTKSDNLNKARNTYKLAVEASIANQNSRPRAEDITSICCSMAVSACLPDKELLQRIDNIIGGFSAPW